MSFEKIKGKLGFGMMRLPMQGQKVDLEQTKQMVDYFMSQGFNYFDTAHPYIGGQSEEVIKELLTSRYPREDYILANKLSNSTWEEKEEIRPQIEKQLEICGVDYFDFFLMHAQNAERFIKYRDKGAYDLVFEMKKEGKLKHVGLSFHDQPEVLDEILRTYPEIEFVQIQYNYLDLDDPNVKSQGCYEVCRKHNKPMIVMEPVKGGTLANLPALAGEVFDKLDNGTAASYALRYVAEKEGIFMILSGMSNMAQVEDNLSFMKEPQPLSPQEHEAVKTVTDILKQQETIACTACQYCVEGCPMDILIPDLFHAYNNLQVFDDQEQRQVYDGLTDLNGKASECIACGQCEGQCPQNLEIIDLMVKVAQTFE